MHRPKICLLFAGGTIGMVRNPKTGALHPADNSAQIIQLFPELQKHMHLDFKMVVNMDSTNMTPKIWTRLANTIHQLYDKYDGFVIAQGTDTMAYSSSALSFAFQNLTKPIVFTGSLIPLNEIGSDGGNNLIYACLTATLDIAEVCIVLASRIMRGNRSKKYHESFSAIFHSPNFPYLGELGHPITLHGWRKKRRKRMLKFQPDFDPNISVLKIFPGFDPVIIEKVLERKAHGIVIEGFGPGNVPAIDNNSIIPQIEKANKLGIPIVIANQMEKGTTNLTAYEAGYQALKAGAISSRDMTTEATITKLMWTLGKTRKLPEIRKIIETNLAGELESQK